MEYFVDENSIVRKIWGKSDTIMFIFAGASAEFALNKAVDWLYFTGRLPTDPLGRLFSTVTYARSIIFSGKESAFKAIDSIAAIHAQVEKSRGRAIPGWAYRDVLFMLIDYSIRSFEALERKLTEEEKQELFEVFYKVGERMGVEGLPDTLKKWKKMRKDHLEKNMVHSHFTDDLYRQYKKHLGFVRYNLLIEVQKLIVPRQVYKLLQFRFPPLITPVIVFYKLSRLVKLDNALKSLLLPKKYKMEIMKLDMANT